MKITVDDKSIEAKDIEQAKEIMKQYEESILASNRVISHYIVDGVDVADIDAVLEGKDSQQIRNIVLVLMAMIKST